MKDFKSIKLEDVLDYYFTQLYKDPESLIPLIDYYINEVVTEDEFDTIVSFYFQKPNLKLNYCYSPKPDWIVDNAEYMLELTPQEIPENRGFFKNDNDYYYIKFSTFITIYKKLKFKERLDDDLTYKNVNDYKLNKI